MIRTIPAALVAAACLAAAACESTPTLDARSAGPLFTICGQDDPDCPSPRETPPTGTFKYWSGGVAYTRNLEKYVEMWSVSQSFENIELTTVSATAYLRDNCESPTSTTVVYDSRSQTVVGSPAWAEVKFVTPRWKDPRKQEWSISATHRFVPYPDARGGGTFTTAMAGRCY